MFWSVSEAIAQTLIDKQFPNRQKKPIQDLKLAQPLIRQEPVQANQEIKNPQPQKSCMSSVYKCFIKIFGCN